MSTRAARKTNHSSAKSQTKSPIRIVPLHPHIRDAAAPAPHLTYRNGPLLTNVEIFTLFWGAAWQDAANTQLSQQMNSFFDFILTSPLLDQLAEYSVPGKSIGHGKRIGTKILATSEPGKSVQDSAIQALLKSELASGTIPPANANSLYFVFLPPGTQVNLGGSASCKDFCGYHEATPNGVFYAAMPFPGCTGCIGGLTLFPALTSTSPRSHPPLRTNSAKPSPTPSPARAGTTITTAKSATSAPGKPNSSAPTPSSSNGPTPPATASEPHFTLGIVGPAF